MQRFAKLLVKIRNEQFVDLIASGSGVDEIGCKRRIKNEAFHRQPLAEQRIHQVLHMMRYLFDLCGEQRLQQRMIVPFVAVEKQFSGNRSILARLTVYDDAGQVRQRQKRHRLRGAPKLEQLLCLLRCPDGLDRYYKVFFLFSAHLWNI